ncbi:hypothetical protein LEP48_08305 [Isoptericola sp. NEAU-Y5]|uniref:Uncharacterized protein n=1 Tax=Isoptericola luteus TaxID=2879484 RepID=A0ABS7ZE82_9MICO|nr:hypothetical protein [Isoptericola sp. NEAU-Y5]MCA5893356.1 hypothetical protein [Isoptericola sp. NEAU-Y5]
MSTPENLLLAQVIMRERHDEAERERTYRRLREQQKLRRTPHARRRRTGIARWLPGRTTA